jgi:hypothetical protein
MEKTCSFQFAFQVSSDGKPENNKKKGGWTHWLLLSSLKMVSVQFYFGFFFIPAHLILINTHLIMEGRQNE